MEKKPYEKLSTTEIVVETESGMMAGSVVDSITMQVEVDDYIETDGFKIGFE